MNVDEEESSIDGSSIRNASSERLSQAFTGSTSADAILIDADTTSTMTASQRPDSGSNGFQSGKVNGGENSFSVDESLDDEAFHGRFGSDGIKASSKTPVRKNTRQATSDGMLEINKSEEKKDDESENSLDDFLTTATAPTEDSEPTIREPLGSEETKDGTDGKKSDGSELPLVDAPGIVPREPTEQEAQPSSKRRGKGVSTLTNRHQNKAKSKKKPSSKRKKKNKRDVMKTADEDSIRSEGSGYSMPSDSETEDEHLPKTQRSEVSLDRVVSMDSGSESDGSTDGSSTGDEGSTDGEGTYTSRESAESRSVYSKDEEYDDDESTLENAESAAQQRSKEKQLLTNRSELREIELGEQSLIRHSPTDLSAAIRKNTFLQKLVLNQRNCDPVSFEILLEGLDQNSSIVQLELHRVVITKEVAIELTSALSRNCSIKKFCLSKCKFVDSGLAILFMGLQHNKAIRHLAIESCNLAGHRSNVIAAAVPLMKLQSIRLQNTKIPDKGMRFFLHNVGKTPSLESLNLSEEKLSESSLEKFVQSIQKCTNLVRLVLSDCGLDESGIEILAEGVEGSEKLESINVSKNRFGDEGADILVELLKCNNTIKTLKCDGCRISRHEKRLLQDALRYNNTFLKSLFSPEVTLSILDSVGLFDPTSSKKS